jgi:oligoendopeptidase F
MDFIDRIHQISSSTQDPEGGRAWDLESPPKWRLEDLYSGMNSVEFAEDLERANNEAAEFAGTYRGKLAALAAAPDAGARLFEAVRAYEALQDLKDRLISYALLLRACDTSDPARGKFYGDVRGKLTDVMGQLLFFELELNRLNDSTLEAVLLGSQLEHYRPWLDDIRRERPHQLADGIEQLFLEKSVTSVAAWTRLFGDTVASLRFKFEGDEVTLEPLLASLQDPDEKKRETAAQSLVVTLGANLKLFTLIINTLAKDKEITDRWRKFEDVADSRHLANRVEREVVDTLVAAVINAYPRLSHRYYALKARWFGKDQLNYWDRNAPLPNAATPTFTWNTARDTVLEAYRAFSPQMSDIAQRFFDERWIDGQVRPGKAPGAFSNPTAPSAHPYVLVNYLGKPRDIMTLAHELGHGVHQLLAAPNGALMARTPLTLAETASVFGEMLTFRTLLAQTETTTARKSILAAKVEDMLNTVVRQIAFYQFERKLHCERKIAELTAERICTLWMSTQSESLGPSIKLALGYEYYWSYIGHFFHSPFYVYAYAFGNCLVNSLFGVYERAQENFVERYLALLSAGGAKPYRQLLEPFGLDPRDPGFWNIGLSLIERMIDELEALDRPAVKSTRILRS